LQNNIKRYDLYIKEYISVFYFYYIFINLIEFVVDPLMGATDFSGSGRVRTWKSEVAGRTHHKLWLINTLIIDVTYTLLIIHERWLKYIHLYTCLLILFSSASAEMLQRIVLRFAALTSPTFGLGCRNGFPRVLAYYRRNGLRWL